MMGRSYETTSLKEIGKRCSNRLPPASTVQAIFQYELHREADVEARFDGLISEIARAEDASDEQDKRISVLETQVTEVSVITLAHEMRSDVVNRAQRLPILHRFQRGLSPKTSNSV